MDPELIKAALEAVAAGDEKKALEILKQMITSAAGGAPAEPAAESASALDDAATPAPKTPEEEAKALRAELAAVKAKQVATEQTEVQKLRAEIDAITAKQAKADGIERSKLVGELVALRAETPITAYAGKPEDKKLCERLASEPVEAMRARVVALRAVAPSVVEAPAGSASDDVIEVAKLSRETLDAIKKRGMTPEQFISERRGVLKANK